MNYREELKNNLLEQIRSQIEQISAETELKPNLYSVTIKPNTSKIAYGAISNQSKNDRMIRIIRYFESSINSKLIRNSYRPTKKHLKIRGVHFVEQLTKRNTPTFVHSHGVIIVHPTLINKFEHLMSIIQPANDDGEIYRQLVNRDRKLGDVCREIDNSLNGLMEDIEVKEVTDLDGAIAYALKNFRMTAYDQTNDCTDAVSSLADDLNVNIGSSLLRRMKNTS